MEFSFRRHLRGLTHRVVYRLRVKAATSRTDTTVMFGFRLIIMPSVFHPKFFLSSRFLGRYLSSLDLQGKSVLEMGCGSGLLSLIAARQGAGVTAVDINPRAVESTRLNAAANGFAGCIRVLQGDVFAPLEAGSRFDLIVWNPPFFPGEPEDDAMRAWKAGDDYELISRFAGGLTERLHAGGRCILIVSSDADADALISRIVRSGFTAVCVHAERMLFETLRVVEFQHAPAGPPLVPAGTARG